MNGRTSSAIAAAIQMVACLTSFGTVGQPNVASTFASVGVRLA